MSDEPPAARALAADATPPVPRAGRWRPVALGAVAGLVLGGGGVGAAWALSTAGSSPPAPTPFTLLGTLSLSHAVDLDEEAASCAGSGGYDDIVQGAAVTVYDATGTVVATGSLGEGLRGQAGYSSAACEFPVTVLGVPAGRTFYAVEIAHRGRIAVTEADAEAGRFTATLG
ncbi:hypothetical protein [Streptomyces sp. NPDC021224]|uniref:hypothetical protein n=1 Tax=unclassified Streptomyces TaxID=2593676 RepID=UPI00378F4387